MIDKKTDYLVVPPLNDVIANLSTVAQDKLK